MITAPDHKPSNVGVWVIIITLIGIIWIAVDYNRQPTISKNDVAHSGSLRKPTSPHSKRDHRASAAELAKMRSEWRAGEEEVMTPGSSIRGQINGLLTAEDPTSVDRHYYGILDAPRDGISQDLPSDWNEARTSLQQSADAVKTAQDALRSWEDGGHDYDDDLKAELSADAQAIVDDMCTTLSQARNAYKRAGGYADALSVLDSADGGKPDPCPDVPMARPYSTTVIGRQLITKSWGDNEVDSPEGWSAFVDDNNGFIVSSGTPVTVIASRYSDAEEINLCKIHGGGGTGWLACRHLAKQPDPAING